MSFLPSVGCIVMGEINGSLLEIHQVLDVLLWGNKWVTDGDPPSVGCIVMGKSMGH